MKRSNLIGKIFSWFHSAIDFIAENEKIPQIIPCTFQSIEAVTEGWRFASGYISFATRFYQFFSKETGRKQEGG